MSEFKEIELLKIVPSKTNPRTEFETNSLRELSQSILDHGILQPIIVRQSPEADWNEGVFELVCGERRYRASILAGLETIPASIRELTDDEVFELQIIENLERKDVHPMDEATAFLKMIDSGKYTMEDVAAKVAKTETFVAQRLKLNDLIPELQEDFKKGEFGIGHAILLSRISEEHQKETFQSANSGYSQGYGTVKELKEEIEQENYDLLEAIFPLDDTQLLPKAGACFNCAKNSSANPVLFPDEKEESICFDKTCYREKEETFYYQTVESVIKENPGIVFVDNYYNFKRKIVESLLKENNKTVLDSYSEYSVDDAGNTVAFHLDKLHYVNIILKESAKSKNISSDPNENIKTEIANLKAKAERALELDREKIYIRAIEEIKEDPEKNKLLLNSEELTEYELKALALSIICYDDERWIKEKYGFNSLSYNQRNVQIDEIFSIQFLNKLIRGKIQRELITKNIADFEKSDRPAYMMDIFKHYFPAEIKLFTLEQNDVAAKRIAKSDARIAELENSLKKDEEFGKQNTTSNNKKPEVDAIQDSGVTTDFPTFEKITRKSKYSLNNSYFKNYHKDKEPGIPFEVYAYFKQHGELPFDMDPEENPNWLYETYIEYQKRAGVHNSQFFTPPKTAERIAELADEYFSSVATEPYVLDACCGFGMLSKPLTEKGFLVQGFDNNFEILKMYSEYTGCISEQENIHSYQSPIKQWLNVVSNPPYEIKELTQFLKLLWDLLEHGGLAILLLPKDFVDKDKPKALVEVLDLFSVMHREDMEEDFARTGVKAEIVVLEKC